MVKRVAIVGAGIAGISTADALRRHGFDGAITMVDPGIFPYDRPPLSKGYLQGTVSAEQMRLQPQKWFSDHAVRLITETSVAAVRTGTGTVELDDGTSMVVDRVVLATGGVAARPPIEGADNNRVHVLRTVHDADRLRAVLNPGTRLLIVGAGLIGSEITSTAIDLGCSVTLVDPVEPPLAAAFGPVVARCLHSMHAARGADVRRASVARLRPTPTGIEVQLTNENRWRSFDAAVLAVGMTVDTTLARAAGLAVNNGIVVDTAQVTSNKSVLAVGDAARTQINGILAPRSEHWEAARQDGERAAAAIVGVAPAPTGAPWFWTDRHGVHVEVVGAPENGENFVFRGNTAAAPFTLFSLHGSRLAGAVSVGDPKAIRAARRMIDDQIDVDAAELVDTGIDLRKILRRTWPEGGAESLSSANVRGM